ncbi:hypothetical protein ACFL3R_01265 [Thermodesulfobacteriota bacterium]
MKKHFQDILDIEDVRGVLFLNFDGKVIFNEFLSQLPDKLEAINWLLFIHTLNGVQEAELVFENSRCYIRRTETGYIFVVMGEAALIEMVRFNCDILLPVFEH